MKLYGLTMRGLFADLGGDAFYKKWERISSGKQPAKAEFGTELLRNIPSDSPIGALFEAALDGNEEAQLKMEAIGPWESTFLGGGYNLERLNCRGRLILALERACAEPERLIAKGEIQSAQEMLSDDPVVSLFLWPEAIECLKRCQTHSQLRPLKASIAIDVQLSCLAALDVEINKEGESIFSKLIPSTQDPGKNPTSLFFKYLRSSIKVKSMKALLEHPKAKGLSLDGATLKRWSSGTHHPDPTWLKPLVKAFFGDRDYAPVWNHYWAAKNLNLIGYMGQTVSDRAQQFIGSEHEIALLPWPAYPFGFAGFEEWAAARYPFWLDYHRKSKEEVSKDGEERPLRFFS